MTKTSFVLIKGTLYVGFVHQPKPKTINEAKCFSQQLLLSLCLSFTVFSLIAHASVPLCYLQICYEGEFGEYIVEYGANYRVLDPFAQPFQLCFYNTTPNAYTLALRMGTVRSESLMRWVWEANRGNPVGEKATLIFGTEGNLVLADANGRMLGKPTLPIKVLLGSSYSRMVTWFSMILRGPLNREHLAQNYRAFQGPNSSYGGTLTLRRLNTNTLSYLRLEIDGNLRTTLTKIMQIGVLGK
ncbi:hypothetical protein GH714_039618 [Hevea brasiliensis]|uniref:Uncharacterized protein n=1 Tax=Hevea brasiliensis TaxID=3981 RepID=A0A6A6KIG1_HEVBR|nr:hypothetical protein GH714_039618 [Hevea brasiliensis]